MPPPDRRPGLDPTLRDVSLAAGVSLATADRVLNGRPGVREATVRRVQEASAQLGYQANPFAARLARGTRFRLAFVLPAGANAFMRGLAEQVGRMAVHFARQRVQVDLIRVDALDPAILAGTLDGLGGSYGGVGVVALDHPLVRAAIDRLAASGTGVVTVVSDAPASRRLNYVGVDNIAAGRTAGTLLGRFVGSRAGPVGAIIASANLRDHSERLEGFTAVLRERHPQLQVAPPEIGQDDDDASARATAALLLRWPGMVGLYAVGAGTGGIAAALQQAGRAQDIVFIAHELTDTSRALLRDGTVDALINQDAGHEARSAARLLLAQLTGEPVLPEQERIRIEIFLRENLP